MSLLPYQVGDQVRWHGHPGRVTQVQGDRVVVEYVDDKGQFFVAITTDPVLRAQRNGVSQAPSQRPWPER